MTDEMLLAIHNEPTVHISRLHIAEQLIADGQCRRDAVEHMLYAAKEIGRY